MGARAAGNRRGPGVDRFLLALHLAAIAAWLAAAAAAIRTRARARAQGDNETALGLHRSASRALIAEHLGLALVFTTGFLVMLDHGWSLSHARWLGTKVGLACFLLVPLEGMHAFIHLHWIRPGLAASQPGAFARNLVRGLGVEEMLRTLELVLFTPALPLLAWLSWRKPF